MAIPVLISIQGKQRFEHEPPDTLQLVTEGSYSYEPGYISFSYVETEMTGLEGVVTTFTITDGKHVTLNRVGKLNSTMEFQLGEKSETLYDTGFSCLLLGLRARSMTVLLNQNGGVFDLEYSIDIEHTASGVNSYHIEIKPSQAIEN